MESLADTVSQDAFYNLPTPEKIVTRAYARKMNIPVTPLYKPRPQPKPRKSVLTPQPVLPPTQHKVPQPPVVASDILSARPSLSPEIVPSSPLPVSKVSLVSTKPTQPHASKSTEPRLVDALQKPEVVEEFSDDISDLLRIPKPLIPQIDKMQTKHVPNQASLNKMLEIIKRKIIRDFNLPLEAQQFSMAQQTSPHFKPVYDYLAHDILPSDKKSARVIIIKSEQYILCNGLLFRIFFPSDSDEFCLQLAVPEKNIDTIIGLHHGSGLLGHGGCTRTYLTIRKNFHFPAMFQRIVSYIQSCNRCQEIKGKRDTVRTFH
jgi:hypothetical protein